RAHDPLPRFRMDSLLLTYLENNFELDWRAEREVCGPIHQTARVLVFPEHVLQQLRSTVSDFRLVADISRSGYRHAEPNNARHFIERSQMLPRNTKGVECGEMSRFAPRFHVELRAEASNEFRRAAFRGKHARQKKKIPRLHRFHVRAERLRRRRKFDAKFFQPLLGAGRPRAFAGYHLPKCAPPSTCSTSPVMWRASVKKTTALAMSSTVEIEPIGESVFRKSSGSSARSGDSTTPGATALNRMCSFAYSEARLLNPAFRPPLVIIEREAGTPAIGLSASAPVMLTMLPPVFCACICLTASC